MRIALLGYKNDFSDYGKAGHRFYRYAYNLRLNLNRIKNLNVDKLEAPAIYFGKSLAMMKRFSFYDFSPYNIVHNIDLAPIFPIRKGSVPFITTAHDFQFVLDRSLNIDSKVKNIKNFLWVNVMLRLSLRALMLSDHLICVSSLTKTDAIKLGYERSKISVVNHGVEGKFSKPIKKRYNDPIFRVGYIGALAPRKNVEFAIKTITQLNDQKIKFEIWGNKEYEYRNLVSLVGKSKSIKFMGFAPEPRIVDVYDSFDVFIFPSYYEGFGMPILEAQARSLPVIIYKFGALPKEVTRYCIKAEDESDAADIINKLKENGYNEKLRKKAAEYARGFTWEKCAKETLMVYKQMLK